jgi:hypothetical protein
MEFEQHQETAVAFPLSDLKSTLEESNWLPYATDGTE